MHTYIHTYTHTHTHTHPSLLVRTMFPGPSCEDTLLHSSYPNDTLAFSSLLLGLLKHLIEIKKTPIFFVGTLLWEQFTHRPLPTNGDCVLNGTYGYI